jgi:hypothetical protein
MCKPIPQRALFKLCCHNKLITLLINDESKGMTSEVGHEGGLGFKHTPIIVGKCKEMNPNTPKGFSFGNWSFVGISNFWEKVLDIKTCSNWAFFIPLKIY